MDKFNKVRKLFGTKDFSSSSSADSVIYVSSSDEEVSGGWDSVLSTDTEEMIRRVETQVVFCPVPMGKRHMTTASDESPVQVLVSCKKVVPPSLTKGTLMGRCALPPRKACQSAHWSYPILHFLYRIHPCHHAHMRDLQSAILDAYYDKAKES